jgi:hypothetical protein
MGCHGKSGKIKGFLDASFDLKTVYTSRRGLWGQLLSLLIIVRLVGVPPILSLSKFILRFPAWDKVKHLLLKNQCSIGCMLF